ncbi:MAG: hypothetical protein ACOC2V_07605 [Alkalispirochaeta sp.]
MVSRLRGGLAVFFLTMILLGVPGSLFSQTAPGPALADTEGIPVEYEDTIRDLVERYEEVRTLLREQIQINTELYSRDEIDAATAELRAEVEELEEENASLRQDYKAVLVAAKNADAETRRAKAELTKMRTGLGGEINTLERVIASIEEERLLYVGGTFSPAGRIGLLGQINLPGTNVGLLTEGVYDLRDRKFTTAFGISFGFFPQRSIVEGWERLRNRFSGTETLDADGSATDGNSGAGSDTSADTDAGDDGSAGSADGDSGSDDRRGTLFRPNRPDSE